MLLRSDDDPASRAPMLAAEEHRCIVALRAVAGPLSGRVLALNEGLELAPHGDCTLELPQGYAVTLRVFREDGRLWLQTVSGCERHPVRVNGVMVPPKLALQPGDQIGVAMHR